jgi:hypothetical protein
LLALVLRIAKEEEEDLELAFDRVALTISASARADSLRGIKPKVPKSKAEIVPPLWQRDVLDESIVNGWSNHPHSYMLGRGVTVETLERWGVCYDDRLGRIVFPVRRFDGALIGLTGRILPEREKQILDLGGDEPTKYHNYTGLNKRRYLYGEHLFIKRRPLVLVEGPVDALKTDQALRDRANTGSTLGKGFTGHHIAVLRWIGEPKVYIFADDDLSGRSLVRRIAIPLFGVVPLYRMAAKQGSDPGAMSEDEIVQAFENAELILGTSESDLFGKDPLGL